MSSLPIFEVFLLFGLKNWVLRVFLQFSLDQRFVGLIDIVIILHLLGKDINVVASDQPGEVFAVLKDVTESIPKVKNQDHFLVIGRICEVLTTYIHSNFQDVDGIFLG